MIFSSGIVWYSAAQNRLTFSGYTKDLVSAIHIRDVGTLWDNLIHNRTVVVWHADTAWTIRADLRTRIFYGDQSGTPFFRENIDRAANDVLDLSAGLRFGDRGYVHTYLDRMYVQYAKDNLEIRAGRQRINWGINTLWNPNDIFNAYAFIDFDYEERPGSDAISVRYYTGDLSSIEIIGKAGDRDRDGAIAGLWRTHAGRYDLQFLGGYLAQSRYIVLGGGWAGSLKNWGFKGEGSVFLPAADSGQTGAAVSAGWDYVFRSGMFVGFGGLYNALGRTSGTLDDLFAFEISARNLYPFRWTVNASVGYPLHPLFTASFTGVYSLARSHPVFAGPAFTWSALRDLDVDLVGQLIFNKTTDRQYVSPVQAVFLRIKWSY